MRRYILSFLFVLALVPASAQFLPGQRPVTPVVPQDTTHANTTWFDPTRAPEKVKEVYVFGVDYRVEAGFVQHQQRSLSGNMSNPFLHGLRLAGLVDFRLPLHFALQTGLSYTMTYGRIDQHWSSLSDETQMVEYIHHRVMEHQLAIPVRAYYVQSLWKNLNLFFYGGPQLEIGLAQPDYLQTHLSAPAEAWLQEQGVPTETYDRYRSELYRTNVLMGLGGGLEWDRYRVVAGYDFGLNNLARNRQVSGQHMWEWGWHVSLSYKL